MQGRLADAERAFADLVSKGRARGELHLTLSAGSLLGQVQRAQGRLSAALQTYQEGLEFAARMGSALAPSAGMAHLGIAQVLYERNQHEQALRHATESITLGRQLTSTQTLANGLTILAWIRQAMGDSSGSRAAMEEAYQLMPNQEIIALQNPVPTERARLLLAQGDPSTSLGQALEAARWLEQRGLKVEDEPDYSKEREYLLLERVLLARNEPDKALVLVERLCARAEKEGRIESLMEARVLQSLVLNAIGEQPQAMLALTRALELAEPEGYIRLFVDEGVPMLRLLRQAESRGVIPAYVAQLLAAFGESALHAAPTGSFLAEPLSARELEILRLVAAGLTTQEISEQLVIAVGTVRTHLKNIFGKLDAHSRLQAVERAHALKLL
jgi:LuxR family maltose regulon positive regulatory protein